MAKKYEHLRGKLPAFQQEPSYQAKVDEAKSSYAALDVTELARELSINKKAKRDYESLISEHNLQIEALSQLLVEALPAMNLKAVELDTGEKCSLQDDPYCNIEDRGKLFAWLRRKKMQSIFTVNWQTMNALVRGMLIDGKPQPPGVKMYLKTYAKITGGSQNGDAE
jgi:hypothetical protein